jgi:CheY-like chemotaxis protein
MPRILIIDHETLTLGTIQSWLIREGYEVVAVPDARNGLLAFQHSPFDVVLIDLLMPGMDGVQTINALRRIRPNVAIVAMSGMTFHHRVRDKLPDFIGLGARLDVTGTLHKPFESAQLIEAIRTCLSDVRQTPGADAA